MYKIFGSKEVFNDALEELSPIKIKKFHNKKTKSFGEGENSIKIACISDTHSLQNRINIPECDLLISCGDLINYSDGERQMKSFSNWFECINSKNKIIVPGNHDKYLEKNKSKFKQFFPTSHYLEYNSLKLDFKEHNILIYGAPCTLRRNLFYFGNAYSLPGDQMKREWEKIPDDTDILITHVPPYDVLDTTYNNKHVGSKLLRNEICNRIQPKIHIFGHNHDSEVSFAVGEFKNGNKCLFVNACVLNDFKPSIIEYKY